MKKVWIINHYAGQMFMEKGMRHYWIAKFLKQAGYEPLVICSNAKHNSKSELYFDFEGLNHSETAEEIGVPFEFIAGRAYTYNGRARILNMIDFYRNLLKCAATLAKKYGKPDIIYASSVHPLSLVAGIKLAKKYHIKCICEVRDLWPESLVAYDVIKPNGIVAKVLYKGEKWIYKKADRVVMTWPGGYDYIVEKGWEKAIPKEKVLHISNGVDLAEYRQNIKEHPFSDKMMDDYRGLKFVYTGSIRKVNNLGLLIDAAKILKSRNVSGFKMFIFGDGDERQALEEKAKEAGLDNIVFMGTVPKMQVPSVLSKSDINILHNSSTILDKYGQSQNKFFEYLASGKPILMTYTAGHSIIKKENCGFEAKVQTPESVAELIEKICTLEKKDLALMSKNAEEAAKEYDFKVLTEKIITLIETI